MGRTIHVELIVIKIIHLYFSIYNIHPPIIIISKKLHFSSIQLMMYMIFIIDYIHHLMNESKILIFV